MKNKFVNPPAHSSSNKVHDNFALLLLVGLWLIFGSNTLNAQGPCGARIWAPNNGTPGVIRCNPNGAQTEDNIPVTGEYQNGDFPSNFPGSTGCNVPNVGQKTIWVSFQLPIDGGNFEFQIVAGSQQLYYAMFYSIDGTCDPSSLMLEQCGTDFSGWRPATSPLGCGSATQYYIAVWNQDPNKTNFNYTFKARNCGSVCGLRQMGETRVSCAGIADCPNSYKVEVDLVGLNGAWTVSAPGACSISTNSGAFGQCGGATNATIVAYFPQGSPYSLSVSGCEDVVVSGAGHPGVSTDISGASSICAGKTATFKASGGTYLWSNNATTESIEVNTSGSYTVTVTNSEGCSTSKSKTLTVNELPTASIEGPSETIEGTDVIYTAHGGISFFWSTNENTKNITVRNSGTYTVTVTDANECTNSSYKTLIVNKPLPIELISFSARAEGRANVLDWVTASERNVESHSIERSADGISNWSEIGRKQGAPDTNDDTRYSMHDDAPLSKSYYRLRTKDFDRKEQLSKIVVVSRRNEQFAISTAYPVPARETVTLGFNSIEEQSLTIEVSDLAGRVLNRIAHSTQSGDNTYELDISGLANGFYLVRLSDGNTSSQPFRIVKY